MKKAEIGKLVAILKAAYPRQELKADTVSTYERLLQDLDHRAAEAAVLRHIATSLYFPTIADIRMAVAEWESGMPSPEQAWQEAAAWLFHGGYSPREVVMGTIAAMGGSWHLTHSTSPSTDRAQFLKLYAAKRERLIQEAAAAGLTGPLRLAEGEIKQLDQAVEGETGDAQAE